MPITQSASLALEAKGTVADVIASLEAQGAPDYAMHSVRAFLTDFVGQRLVQVRISAALDMSRPVGLAISIASA